MHFTTTNELTEVVGGVEILSPTVIFIFAIGILITVDIPLQWFWKGKKIKSSILNIFMENFKLLVNKQT